MASEFAPEPRNCLIRCGQYCRGGGVRLLEGDAVCAGDPKSYLINVFNPGVERTALVNGFAGSPGPEEERARVPYAKEEDHPSQLLPISLVFRAHYPGFRACLRVAQTFAAQRSL